MQPVGGTVRYGAANASWQARQAQLRFRLDLRRVLLIYSTLNQVAPWRDVQGHASAVYPLISRLTDGL